MSALTATIVYLVVSTLSFTTQTIALIKILRRPAELRVAHRGLTRTACCRVATSTVYVGVGTAALVGIPQTGIVALLALIVAQVVWQTNAVLDVRLNRRLDTREPRRPRHVRRSRRLCHFFRHSIAEGTSK